MTLSVRGKSMNSNERQCGVALFLQLGAGMCCRHDASWCTRCMQHPKTWICTWTAGAVSGKYPKKVIQKWKKSCDHVFTHIYVKVQCHREVGPAAEGNVEICKTKWKQHATKQRDRLNHILSCIIIAHLSHAHCLSSVGSPSAGVLQEHMHYTHVWTVYSRCLLHPRFLMCVNNRWCPWRREQHIHLYILRSRVTPYTPPGASTGKDFFLSVTFSSMSPRVSTGPSVFHEDPEV